MKEGDILLQIPESAVDGVLKTFQKQGTIQCKHRNERKKLFDKRPLLQEDTM